jgi:hypothetical protein
MLRRPSNITADCHRRASEAAQRADRASTPQDKAFWLGCEQRWLDLAKHQEDSERLNDFVMSRSAFSRYRVRLTDDGMWEWHVLGNRPNAVFAGVADSSGAARLQAFRFVSGLTDDSVD